LLAQGGIILWWVDYHHLSHGTQGVWQCVLEDGKENVIQEFLSESDLGKGQGIGSELIA
jgi:hypothetical protein